MERRVPVNVDDWTKHRKFAVIIDAGSSGSRVQVYSWKDHHYARIVRNATQLQALPQVEKGVRFGEDWTLKILPGISSFATNPQDIGPTHLKQLYDFAERVVPVDKQSETPIYLQATAGMRLLDPLQQQTILSEACNYTKQHTKFLINDCLEHFEVISGEAEGLYGWMSVNYLLGGYDAKADGKHRTYGFLDMGGASAQIAFIPNATETEKHAEDLTMLRLRTLGGDSKTWKVFVSTWLGFGANQARGRHIEWIIKSSKPTSDIYYPDPCIPKGRIDPIPENLISTQVSSNSPTKLIGTGSLSECLTQLEPLLSKDAPCPDYPCLFAGVHAPYIDFDVNHFIGISEYYYSTQDIFGLGGAYDYHTLSNAVEQFCSRSWIDIETDLMENKFGGTVDKLKLHDVCFKTPWMMNVLHNGIGIPRVTKEDGAFRTGHNGTRELKEGARIKGFAGAFNSAERLGGAEISWTLGKTLLLVSSSVPASDNSALPVGYGPNKPNATFRPAAHILELNNKKRLVMRKSSGSFFLLCLLFALLYILVAKARPARVISALSSIWIKPRKIISARGDNYYERVNDEENELEMDSRKSKDNGIQRTSSSHRLHVSQPYAPGLKGLTRVTSRTRLAAPSRDHSPESSVRTSTSSRV